MNKLKVLNKQVPKNWKNRNGSAQIYIPDGWADLVLECHEKLVALNPNYQIHQIKEKFGALRFYIGYNTDDENLSEEMSQIINEYEHKSNYVCEVCGEAGEIRQMAGIYRTLCNTHWNMQKS